MSSRKALNEKQRTDILIANRHACCVCGDPGVQIHHINGDPSDNVHENLAVLCLPHHDKATSPPGLSASLKPEQIHRYKENWEKQCEVRAEKLANGRASFFMVDYKNAERIRQLYSQLSEYERMRAYEILGERFRKEALLRKEQGFEVSLEPTTDWNPLTEKLLDCVKSGEIQPEVFNGIKGHPNDPLLPAGPAFGTLKPHYDVWCQIMVRAIITARRVYDLDDLMLLERPEEAGLQGVLVSFKSKLTGDVAIPAEWEQRPVSDTTLFAQNNNVTWESVLHLKTHYVYSFTASNSLSDGIENGILFLRQIRDVKYVNDNINVVFESTPLILGVGALEIT